MSIIKKTYSKVSNKFIDLYEPHLLNDSDIFVGSFPKSGKTWVRFFIANYLTQYLHLNVNIDWNNFTIYAPGLLKYDPGALRKTPQQISRMIFSHNRPIAKYFPGRKVLFITRNMADIVVSYYHYHKTRKNPEYANYDIDTFAHHVFDISEAVERLNLFASMLQKSKDCLIIPYENLVADPQHQFRKIVDFSEWNYLDDIFEYALDRSSFENMKKLENQKGKDDNSYHVRKGKSNTAFEELRETTIEYINEFVENNLDSSVKPYYVYSG